MTAKEGPRTIPTIRVLLADDHDILRQGLQLLLETQQDIEVVGEVRTGREALELALSLKPDVAIVDITMPDLDGLGACQRIRHEQPTTQVLILTMHESEEYFLQALRMGAAGYLVKKAAPTDLIAAVRIVANGGVYLYPGLAKVLVHAYLSPFEHSTQSLEQDAPQNSSKSAQLAQAVRILTPREMEVLKLVAEGCTNQEIANQLVLSIKTVQAHRANVMDKLELHDVTHLVRFAIRHGLISPE